MYAEFVQRSKHLRMPPRGKMAATRLYEQQALGLLEKPVAPSMQHTAVSDASTEKTLGYGETKSLDAL